MSIYKKLFYALLPILSSICVLSLMHYDFSKLLCHIIPYKYFASIKSDITSSKLGYYYTIQGMTEENFFYRQLPMYVFDKEGIPMVFYNRPDVYGPQYNPGEISVVALTSWGLYQKTNKIIYRDLFIKLSDWLVNHSDGGKWYYNYDFCCGMRKPWISALAQSEGISVLLRAYQLTNNQKYLDSATKAFDIMSAPIDKGGTLYIENTNTYWLEEYPDIKLKSHVMNGHIFALFGVWDYYRVTNSPKALELFTKGVNALKDNLYKYDTGNGALYCLAVTAMCDDTYLEMEIGQLNELYAITNEALFLEYATKWKGYLPKK